MRLLAHFLSQPLPSRLPQLARPLAPLAAAGLLWGAIAGWAGAAEPKRIAALVTTYFQNSHADVIVSRLLQTYTLDDKGESPNLKLVSLYTDQVPSTDISRELAGRAGVPICASVTEALTLGTGSLAVDGVLLVAEHGDYPTSPTGQTEYPKRRFFTELLEVFDASGRVVPVFIDKHLGHCWEDANFIYAAAAKRQIPLMAGSSLPTSWRHPALDLPRGSRVAEFSAISYHTLDAYGFHALEMLACLAERRAGGETGVRAVQCLTGPAVWEAGGTGLYDRQLFDVAFARQENPQGGDVPLPERVPEPVLCHIEYVDGTKANVFTLNGAAAEWTIAWRLEDAPAAAAPATLFWTQEARPFAHFTNLVRGIDSMMQTGQPAWPVERTLLTSGTLSALLESKLAGGTRIETPHLAIKYETIWNWTEPPPPEGRPIDQQ